MTVVRTGSATDVGRVRAVNEDHVLATNQLFAVADGMGGHAGGEVAARVAIEALRRSFERQPGAEGLLHAIEDANAEVWRQSITQSRLRGMGTTVVAAALVPGEHGRDDLVLANVGDSRAYRYRAGRIEQLTTDHSVAEELVARGELTASEAAFHPHRHILTRALGVSSDVEIDAWRITPSKGDRYLLCSDGLTNEVSSDRIEGVFGSTPDPQKAADALVRMANEHGGSDNISVLVIDVVVADEGPDGAAADGVGADAGDPGAGDPDAPPTPATPLPITPSAARLTGLPPAAPGAGGADVPAGADGPPAGDAHTTGAEAAAGDLTEALPTPGDGTGAAVGRPGPPTPRRQKGPRLVTVRLVLFLLVLVAIAGGSYGALRWYVENSYFVTLQGRQLVVERGRPGGFLGFRPSVAERTGVVVDDVLAYEVTTLQGGVEEPSLSNALSFVRNLVVDACESRRSAPGVAPLLGSTTTTPTSAVPTTTSSVARATTTTYYGETTTTTRVRRQPTTTTTTTTTLPPYVGPTTTTSIPAHEPAMARCPKVPIPTVVNGTTTTTTTTLPSTTTLFTNPVVTAPTTAPPTTAPPTTAPPTTAPPQHTTTTST